MNSVKHSSAKEKQVYFESTDLSSADVMTPVKFQNKSLCLPEPMTTWTTEESRAEAGRGQSRSSSSFIPWTNSDQHTTGSDHHQTGNSNLVQYHQRRDPSEFQPLSVAVFFFRTLFRWSKYSKTPLKTWSTSLLAQKVLALSEKHTRTDNKC